MSLRGTSLKQPIQLAKLLKNGLSSNPDSPALVSADQTLSWQSLDDESSRWAATLLARGLRPGDRVASLMPNRPFLTVHYLACIKAGLVATPLNYRYTAPEIDHALEVSGASLLLVHEERLPDVAASRLAQKLTLGVITYSASAQLGNVDLSSVLSQPVLPPQTELAKPAIIFFTSGSTGKPKGVTHSLETVGWMVASVVAAMEFSRDDVLIPGTSHSHIAGWLLALAGLAAGAKVLVPRTIDGHELLPLLRNYRPTFLCMLPAALFALVRDHDARREDFRSLRLCISGGDKVSLELEKEFNELTGLTLDETYGMTEIGFTTANPVCGTIKAGSIGRACPGYELEIRSESLASLPAGSEGRLWVKAPTNMIGYWQNESATNSTIKDGWLDTGDLMQADEDGYLWFRGRQKQIIIHDGSNICPQEVEEALLEHPAVENAGVIGIHNLVHGENVRAYVTLRPGIARPTDAELIQFSRARVGYKSPEEIVILDEMPLNATGKVDRVALKQMSQHATVV